MREILFRGKSAVNCEWVYGYPVPFDNVTGWAIVTSKTVLVPEYATVGSGYFIEVLNDTICQYTGLKDKNGNRIFEGDILEWDANEFGCLHREEVKWDYGLLGLREKDWAEWCNVIGNVYDNPDLLKDDKPKQDIGWE